ncbi:MAG: VWA domain-containing protein, partial [Acidobacteria bacterium]|nr:VWA domain-containing protein [Acidobacteriota bacterium]
MKGGSLLIALAALLSYPGPPAEAQALTGGFGKPANAATPTTVRGPEQTEPQRQLPSEPVRVLPLEPPPVAKTPAPRLPAPKKDDETRAVASVSVGYVLVPMTILDRNGVAIRDLGEKDITLLSDGEAVKTDLFERVDDVPVSFTILLDGSGSMALLGKMDGARAAIRTLLDARKPGDDFTLYVFSMGEVRLVVPFTEDAEELYRGVAETKPWGRTAFFDALARMPDRTLLGRNGARVIILLTDGIDNASELSREGLTQILEGIDVPVYPMGLRSTGSPTTDMPGVNPETLLNLDVLGHIARSSGGRLEVASEPAELVRAVLEMLRDLRSQYLLGFAPTGRGPVRYRQLSVRIDRSFRTVKIRAGYRGSEP